MTLGEIQKQRRARQSASMRHVERGCRGTKVLLMRKEGSKLQAELVYDQKYKQEMKVNLSHQIVSHTELKCLPHRCELTC